MVRGEYEEGFGSVPIRRGTRGLPSMKVRNPSTEGLAEHMMGQAARCMVFSAAAGGGEYA